MTTLAYTLSERYWPRQNSRQRDFVLITASTLLIAILAQVRIVLPFTPVPITGQTLGVLLTGALLGSRRGALALALYLVEGILGLPVFTGGGSGMTHLVGATGGYLIGFVVAAWVVGWLCEHGLERDLRSAWAPFLAGEALIYLMGVPWLARFVGGVPAALSLGLLPFLPGDLIKMLLAATLLPTAWQRVKTH